MSIKTNVQKKSESWYIKAICLVFSLSFFAACLAAASWLDLWSQIIPDWCRILFSPSPLVTDYYELGNLASAFFNAGACGLACTLIMVLIHAECDVNTLAGFFLVVAHCFYGLNFLNMWPPILGILLFCICYKIEFRANVGMAMFSTAFGPFISELLFRYQMDTHLEFPFLHLNLINAIYIIVFIVFLGFAIPAMLPGALRLHKGFNLYNGGLAFGLLGLFLYAYMYKTFGIESSGTVPLSNPVYEAHGKSYGGFLIIFFLILFTLFLFWGWFENGKTFRGYGLLLSSTGYKADFTDQFGIQFVLMNIGFYGYMILAYFTAVILFTDGAGFTGATTGIIIAALTFTGKGQHPRNVWPILLGFVILSTVVSSICTLGCREIPWTLSTQGYMNGAAFATGLCPIAGYYGKRYGVIAGFVCAVICTSTSVIHGGFMLYNGGLSAGITALIIVPFMEYYWKNPKTN